MAFVVDLLFLPALHHPCPTSSVLLSSFRQTSHNLVLILLVAERSKYCFTPLNLCLLLFRVTTAALALLTDSEALSQGQIRVIHRQLTAYLEAREARHGDVVCDPQYRRDEADESYAEEDDSIPVADLASVMHYSPLNSPPSELVSSGCAESALEAHENRNSTTSQE